MHSRRIQLKRCFREDREYPFQFLSINQFQRCPYLPLPPGNRGSFAHVVSPGLGHLSGHLSRPRGWALAYPRLPGGHLAHMFSKDGWVYQEGRGLCQSQSFPPKESNRCINLRGRKQGVFAQQKADNCSFVQKRRNFVTGLFVVYLVTGHYKVAFLYENKTKTRACRHARVVRNKFFFASSRFTI